MLVSKQRYQGLEVEHYANIEPKRLKPSALKTTSMSNKMNLIWEWPGPGPTSRPSFSYA